MEHLSCSCRSQTTPSDSAKTCSSQRVKATNVSDVSLLTARDTLSEGATGHLGLVLGVRCPSWTFPMPNVILKCQIGLFHSLKNAGYLAFLLWFLELQCRVWTKKGNSYTHGRYGKTPKVMLHYSNDIGMVNYLI